MGVLVRVRNADILRDYVRLSGVTHRELARRAGLGHATVNHLLTGRRPSCSPSTAKAIEVALGAMPGVFFEVH